MKTDCDHRSDHLYRARVVSIRLADTVSHRPAGQAANLIATLLDRVAHWPAVQRASLSTLIPLSGDEVGINVAVTLAILAKLLTLH